MLLSEFLSLLNSGLYHGMMKQAGRSNPESGEAD